MAARMGSVTAESVAERHEMTLASARARLGAAARAGLVYRRRPLSDQPALYAITRAGMHKVGLHELGPVRVSAANAQHMIACARACASLERCYSGHEVRSERELRRDERERRAPLASARLSGSGWLSPGGRALHRPDLVLWPCPPGSGRPIAVEVELTVKSPRRLAEICQAWARARCVAGVLYLAAPEVEGALRRAIERAQAHDRVLLVPLAALPRASRTTESREPSQGRRNFA